mmetsp:Transcript_10866/g.24665  ORF Transcript_10866/g.24665 Transcript_10866/m.24665 type:complete len:326 (+) Transcript_10866:88-1065(+)
MVTDSRQVLLLSLLLIHFSTAERMQLDTPPRLQDATLHNHTMDLDEESSLSAAQTWHQEPLAVPAASHLQTANVVKGNLSVNMSKTAAYGAAAINASSFVTSEGTDMCPSGMLKVEDCSTCEGNCKACYEESDPSTAIRCVSKHIGSSCTSSKSWGHWTKKCLLQVAPSTRSSSSAGAGHTLVWVFGALCLLAIFAGAAYLVKYHLEDSPPQGPPPGSMPPQEAYSVQSNFGLSPPVNGAIPPQSAAPQGYYDAPPPGYDAPPSGYYNAAPPAGFADGSPPPSGFPDPGAVPSMHGQPPSGFHDAVPPGTGQPMQPEGPPPPAAW